MSSDIDDPDLHLPFPDFVEQATSWAESWETVTEDEPLFHFVRAIKAHPRMAGATAETAHAALVRQARSRGDQVVVGNFDLEEEDGEVAFHSMWDRVRFPLGADPVEVACRLAGTGLIKTQRKRPGRYERFLTAAALLQIQVRQKPILLPVRKIANHMPCESNTANAWINWAREDSVLVKTKDHAFRSQGESRAAEYVMGLHLWRGALPKLSALVGISVREQDLRWIEEQFATARGQA